MNYDAIVVGAGPAGSVCAASLASAGRRVLLLERARFPRDKVCGDCLNPSVWPILDRLALRDRLLALPHAVARSVSYHGIDAEPLEFPVAHGNEIVVRRRDLDALLVRRAVELGAEFREDTTVTQIAPGWSVETSAGPFSAPLLFAADGRNSTVARLAGLLPAAGRERTAIQCHCARPAWHADGIRMLFYPGGYGGTAPLGNGRMNLCLVATPASLESVRQSAAEEFHLGDDVEWRTIAPLSRADPRHIAKDGLFLLGDAARVVEPFTGEGIYYAMRSGELAAQSAIDGSDYTHTHAAMYRGRLWINRLARLAGLNPRATSAALRLARLWPAPLRALTARVVGQT